MCCTASVYSVCNRIFGNPKKKDKQKDINNKWVYRFRTRLDQLASWPAVLVAAAEEEKRRPMRECACTSFIGDKNQGKKKERDENLRRMKKGPKESPRVERINREMKSLRGKKKKKKEETSGAKTRLCRTRDFPFVMS